jgi:hypothetical protein
VRKAFWGAEDSDCNNEITPRGTGGTFVALKELDFWRGIDRINQGKNEKQGERKVQEGISQLGKRRD